MGEMRKMPNPRLVIDLNDLPDSRDETALERTVMITVSERIMKQPVPAVSVLTDTCSDVELVMMIRLHLAILLESSETGRSNSVTASAHCLGDMLAAIKVHAIAEDMSKCTEE